MRRSDSEAQSGKIGIFWEVNGELIFKTTMVSDVHSVEGIRDVDDDHFSYWDQLAISRSDLIMYSYDHFPRGRIVYREADNKFVIFGDRCVLSNKKFIGRLRNEFGLLPRHCVVKSDGHYQCHRCNPFFVSDSTIMDDF